VGHGGRWQTPEWHRRVAQLKRNESTLRCLTSLHESAIHWPARVRHLTRMQRRPRHSWPFRKGKWKIQIRWFFVQTVRTRGLCELNLVRQEKKMFGQDFASMAWYGLLFVTQIWMASEGERSLKAPRVTPSSYAEGCGLVPILLAPQFAVSTKVSAKTARTAQQTSRISMIIKMRILEELYFECKWFSTLSLVRPEVCEFLQTRSTVLTPAGPSMPGDSRRSEREADYAEACARARYLRATDRVPCDVGFRLSVEMMVKQPKRVEESHRDMPHLFPEIATNEVRLSHRCNGSGWN
jgi:hypothetical protein